MKAVGAEISAMSSEQIATLEKEGKMNIAGHEITIDDVEILTKDIPGWTVTSEGRITVALDLTVTDELRAEGVAREFVNRVQNLRKDKDFDLMDKISIQLEENNPFKSEINANNSYISAEVLANNIEFVDSLSQADEIEINNVYFKININRV